MFEDIDDRLLYYPTVTREPFRNRGRITELLVSDRFYAGLGVPCLDALHDRALLCGSEGLLGDVRNILTLTSRGFDEASHTKLGRFAVEKAFVSR